MAEAVIFSSIEKLDDLLFEKADILIAAWMHMRGLRSDLTLMKDFLSLFALSKRALNLKEWSTHHFLISQVREMAHDAETIIETFIIKSSANSLADRVHRVYHFCKEIASFRRRLRQIKKPVRQLVVEWAEVAEGPMRSEYTEEEEEGDVVGLEEHVEYLLRTAILNEGKGLSIKWIKGMAGVGKTTLAKQLYNHPTVGAEFETRAWVFISSESSIKGVVIRVLRQVRPDLPVKMLWEQRRKSLAVMLYQQLQRHRYFIVLDDAWKHINMKAILQIFPDAGNASRLLLTTRNNVNYYAYTLETLDGDNSWKLFMKTVFTNNQKCPKYLEKLGRQILTKCSGLPLAIKDVGRQLALKEPSQSEWEEFQESMDLSVTLEVLELSYQILDPLLKSYFLCLAFFKEGTTISTEKLLQVWVIGGLISDNEEMHGAFMNSRKLFFEKMVDIKDRRPKNDTVKNIQVNHVFHKLSIKKAEEEIGFEILRNHVDYGSFHKTRHRVVYCSREKFKYSMNPDKHLISHFFHGGGNFDTSPSYWMSFELLRILDFEGFGLKLFPESVCSLTRLRYLGLRNNHIQELPHMLGCLKRLEILDIAQNFMLEMPDVIWEMDSLRHLYMSDVICRKPLKIDALKNLQSLTYISVENWMYELSGLQMMTSLRTLGIEEVDEKLDVSKIFSSLAKMRLSCLILRGFRYRSLPSLDKIGILHGLRELKLHGLLTKLPRARNFPPNLCYLTLVNSCLDEDPMLVLGKLSKLSYLKLRNAYIGLQMVIQRLMFSQLKVLCFEELWHLRSINIDKDSYMNLDDVEISSCPYLETTREELLKY